MMITREEFSYDNLPQELVENIIQLRSMKTNTVDQRKQYMKLYSSCYGNLRELGYPFDDINRSIITGCRINSSIPINKKNRIISMHGGCAICGLKIESLLTAHHVIPKSYGGHDNDDNLIPVCVTCHKILHILTGVKAVPNNIISHIKRNRLMHKFYKYTAHLDNSYFTKDMVSECQQQLELDDRCTVDYWL